MKRNLLIIPLLTLALAACGQGGGAGGGASIDSKMNEGKELASKGGVTIHEGYVDLIKRVNPTIEGQISTPAGKKRLVDSLLEQELFYKAATQKGIDKLPQFQEKLALYQRAILGQSLLEEEINKKSQDYYEANKDKEFTRIKLAHILIKVKNPEDAAKPPVPAAKAKPVEKTYSEEEALKVAQDVKAKLAGGMDWNEAVNQFSMDNMSKSRQGALGYLSRGDRRVERMGWEEMVDKAFAMKVGDVSEPIKAKDGYHLVKVEEAASPIAFEEAQNTIKFKLRADIRKEILDGIAKGETEYKDPELKATPEPGMAFPGQPGAPAPGAAPGAKPGPSLQVTPKKPDAPEAPKANAQGTTTAKSQEAK